jgi:malate dehydrogenase (oxaloacetate-decarboxylating)
MVKGMAKNAIVFAMANPIPEIQPELIYDLVAVVATGRIDYPNQINNVLAFPGLFRWRWTVALRAITDNMYLEAARSDRFFRSLLLILIQENIIPSVFDSRVVTAVAAAVQHAARQDGVAGNNVIMVQEGK